MFKLTSYASKWQLLPLCILHRTRNLLFPKCTNAYSCFFVRNACHQLHLISFILLELARSCMSQYGNIRSKKNVADLNFAIRPDLTVAKCHILVGPLWICFVVVAILFSFCLAKLECGFNKAKFTIIAMRGCLPRNIFYPHV